MKKIFVCMFLFALIMVSGCSSDAEVKPAAVLDITREEFVNLLSENSGIDLDLSFISADEEKGQKTAFYTFETDNDTAETKTHYTITYDAATNKISCVDFDVAKSFMGDLTSARTRYYYHIMAVAGIIYPNMNTDEIFDTIKKADIENGEFNTAIYNNDKFTMVAYAFGTEFNAGFMPNEQET